MAAKGRRRAPDVDCDVKDAAARAAHELILRERRRLEVQSAQGADRRRIGMVILHKGEIKTRLVPVGAVVNLGEEPSGVAVLLRRHDLDRRNRGLFHLHRAPRPSARPARAASLPEAAARGHPQIVLLVRASVLARRPYRALDQTDISFIFRPRNSAIILLQKIRNKGKLSLWAILRLHMVPTAGARFGAATSGQSAGAFFFAENPA